MLHYLQDLVAEQLELLLDERFEKQRAQKQNVNGIKIKFQAV
jgi:hypothetical protein